MSERSSTSRTKLTTHPGRIKAVATDASARRGRRITRAACAAVVLASARNAAAQGVDQLALPWRTPVNASDVAAGGADEDRLLQLQLVGLAPAMPSGIRRFSPLALDSLVRGDSASSPRSGALLRLLPLRGALQVNTTQPFSENDGVMWAGRGVTMAAAGGGSARFKWFSAALRPEVFWTQNLSFRPPLHAARPAGSYASASYPGTIDLPYRFGPRQYGRIDPGESWIRADTRLLSGGFSTAAETWGPAHVYPLLMSSNAGGFPHVFIESGLPWNVLVGHVAFRSVTGQLQHSAYDAPGRPKDRLGAGLVLSFVPRYLEPLEVGAGRFFHRDWPTGGVGLNAFKIPFEQVFSKYGLDVGASENQLASLFFRLSPPRSGAELYGEYLRDDHSADSRDLLVEPDHESAYLIGMRKAWLPADSGHLTVLTFEAVNGRITHLQRVRGETVMYVHDPIVEGHTLRGQLLGSNPVFGGDGYIVRVDRSNARGGWQLSQGGQLAAQNEQGGLWNGQRVGFSFFGAQRSWARGAGARLFSAGANLQIPWNDLEGGTNLSVFLSTRLGR